MFWFVFFTFIGVYTAMQAFFYVSVCRAYSPGRWARAGLAGLLALTVVAPIWSRLLDKAGHEWLSRGLGIMGYTWMVLVFWFCCLGILFAIWNGAVRTAATVRPGLRRLVLSRRTVVGISMVLLLAGTCWGLIEASRIQVKQVRIRTPRLPAGSEPVRVVQISDVHIGRPRGYRFVQKLVDLLKEQRPDILVSTGDLTDTALLHRPELSAAFRELNPPLGKYAVTGNHDYYADLDRSLAFHRASGFRVLRGEWVRASHNLYIAGVDDPAGTYTGQRSNLDEEMLLKAIDPAAFVILLKHQPKLKAAAVNRFDLQLSGHTHGGQVFPFQVLVRLLYPFISGMHRVSDRSLVYVNRGTGVWGAPLRVLAPAEITVFILEPQ